MKWYKHWAGRLSLLTSTYCGKVYTLKVKDYANTKVHKTIITIKDGFSVANMKTVEFKEFGEFLAKRVEEQGKQWCLDLKNESDKMLVLLEKLKERDLTYEEFMNYVEELYAYSKPHMVVKKVIDYLSPDQLEKFLPMFEDARLYSEKVYAETEKFTIELAKMIGKKVGYEYELILCLTDFEFEKFLKTKKLPSKKVLEKRNKSAVLVFDNGKYKLVVGDEVSKIEEKIAKIDGDKNQTEGMIAYKGIVKGKVRIIFNPEKKHKFDEGDILITGMTRPVFTKFIEKAGAIVTDAGGILSHAAIVSREMKKPTIVGTLNATTIFKDGDIVEVDADKGVVRKI